MLRDHFDPETPQAQHRRAELISAWKLCINSQWPYQRHYVEGNDGIKATIKHKGQDAAMSTRRAREKFMEASQAQLICARMRRTTVPIQQNVNDAFKRDLINFRQQSLNCIGQ